eukprot:IDg6737t1
MTQIGRHRWDIGKAENASDIPDHRSTEQKKRLQRILTGQKMDAKAESAATTRNKKRATLQELTGIWKNPAMNRRHQSPARVTLIAISSPQARTPTVLTDVDAIENRHKNAQIRKNNRKGTGNRKTSLHTYKLTMLES